MHNSFLLDKIVDALQHICEDYHINKIKEVVIEINYNSHIDSHDLQQHLLEIIPKLVDSCTIISVKKAELKGQTAVIYMLKGDESI